MIKVPPEEKTNKEPVSTKFSVALTVFLMLSFLGATMYVLISSLL